MSLRSRPDRGAKEHSGPDETKAEDRGIFEMVFAFKAHLVSFRRGPAGFLFRKTLTTSIVFLFSSYTLLQASVKDVDSRGNLLITASTDETMRIYNLRTRCDSGVLTKHEGSVTCVRLSQNSKYLISCGEDRAVHIWRCTNWDPVKSFESIHDSTPISADFHPSMKLALTLDIEGNLCMLDLLKGVLAVKFAVPGLGKKDSRFNRRFGLFTTVRFCTTGSHYVVLSQRELVVVSLENDQDWFLSSSTTEMGLGAAQITSFCWITDLIFLVGFSNGQLRMLQISGDKLNLLEVSFSLPGQSPTETENPHLRNRIKGICTLGRDHARSQTSNHCETLCKLVTCDSSGVFVLFSLALSDDPETGRARCELEILDVLNSDNRITCMTVENKNTAEEDLSSFTSLSNSSVPKDQSRLSSVSVSAKGNKKPKAIKQGKPTRSKTKKDNSKQ